MNPLLREEGEFSYDGLNLFKDFSKLTDDWDKQSNSVHSLGDRHARKNSGNG